MPRTKSTTTAVKKDNPAVKVVKPRKPRVIKVKLVEQPIKQEEVKVVSIPMSSLKFLSAVGKRKSAVAQIKLYFNGEGKIEVNGKAYQVYFPVATLQQIITSPLELAGHSGTVNITAKISGGGIRGQAESLRLAIVRALVKFNVDLRKTFRGVGLMTRDARVKERKKYGLKRARRAPQWQKR